MGIRVHLIDGTYELFRAHYSPRPGVEDPHGKDIKATVGVVQSLLGLLHDSRESVTHIGIAFDNPIRSFRNDLFDGYKTEAGVEPALLAQFDDVERAVAALGVRVWSMDEFEADDALATAAQRLDSDPAVEQIRVMTPDKDLGQVLKGERVVQIDRMRQKLITEATLRADRGFGPESIPDFLALVGDTADGIPGIDGWGEKSTAAVLAAYPHLEDIPALVTVWRARPRGAERLSANLESARGEARLYRTLATLRTDANIDCELEAVEWKGVPREKFEQWCGSVNQTKLLATVKRWEAHQ